MAKTLIPKNYKANIERALHNLYQEKATTLHPMLAIPIYYRRLFRGQRVDFAVLESILRSEPTFAPLLNNWRLEFQWYFDSDANRYGWIDNNTRLTSEEVMNRKHHTCVFPFALEEGEMYGEEVQQLAVKRHSMHDYAGVAPQFVYLFNSNDIRDIVNFPFHSMNIDFHLTYLNIIRNYHVNRQFPSIPYIGIQSYDNVTPDTANLGTDTYDLDDMDNLFMFLRSCPNGVKFDANDIRIVTGIDDYPCDAPTSLVDYYGDAVRKFNNYLRACRHSFGGLFCTQFEPDLYQNLLSQDQQLLRSMVTTETIDGQTGITIEQFRLKNHLQGLYDKIFVSGGTDRDLSRTLWGIESNRDYDIPELLSVHSEIIGTNLIQSSTAGESSGASSGTYSNVPGSMAGNINTRRGKGRSQRFTAKTSGSLMCIVTLTPIISYSQNIERHLLENNFMDEFTPDMARKGFENVPLSDYCVLPTGYISSSFAGSIQDAPNFEPYFGTSDISNSVGKQVAWLREMTAVNRVHGDFSNGGERNDWVLRRDFQVINAIDGDFSENGGYLVNKITPYGHPLAFQYPFVSQDLNSPNFNLQVAFKIDTYSPVPRKFMPNLGF